MALVRDDDTVAVPSAGRTQVGVLDAVAVKLLLAMAGEEGERG
jgi:hypothetical protein